MLALVSLVHIFEESSTVLHWPCAFLVSFLSAPMFINFSLL